jgi:hypothetical protein
LSLVTKVKLPEKTLPLLRALLEKAYISRAGSENALLAILSSFALNTRLSRWHAGSVLRYRSQNEPITRPNPGVQLSFTTPDLSFPVPQKEP